MRTALLFLALCVGAACAVSCTAPDGRVGVCQVNTTPCSGGVYLKNLCAGPVDVQCCVVGPAPATKLHGPDVSHYQTGVQWATVKSGGAAFAFAKATEGSTYTDPTFAANWKAMQAAGLVRGAYHFGHTNADAVQQATRFVQTVQNAGGFKMSKTLPLVLDIEVNDGMDANAVWAWTQKFCATTKQLTGKAPMLYTYMPFWNSQMGNPTSLGSCAGASFWVAAYTASPPKVPAVFGGQYTFWQYTDKKTMPGISAPADDSYFAGTQAQLEALCFA